MFDPSKDYLHEYESISAFTEDYNGTYYHEPWVSAIHENSQVDYNKIPIYSVTVTYQDRIHTADTFTETDSAVIGDPVVFAAPPSPVAPAEHEFLGWATSEYPTSQQLQDSNFIKAPGSPIELTNNTTLYAVYGITFQELINEGYVRFGQADPTGANAIAVLPNNYAKELVLDFMDVFNNEPDKLILRSGTTYGYVGSGTSLNTFIFSSITQQHWLTTDEWYDIFNNRELKTYPTSRQFYGINWSDKEEITIIYHPSGGASNWCASSRAFGRYMPRVLNVQLLGGSQYAYLQQTFGDPGYGCGSEVINLSRGTYGKITAYNRGKWQGQGCNAAFEGARSLKEVHGFESSAVTVWLYTFDGCRAIETIPASDFNSAITCQYELTQTFCNCWLLEKIEPILYVSAVTDTTATFHSCTSLTQVYLHGINAASNIARGGGSFPQNTAYTWDLSSTLMTQACANYAITNLTPCDTTVEGFVMKGINFPTTVTLNSSQIADLRQNGWIPYINGAEQFPAS